MKHNKIIAIVFTAVNAILITVCCVFLLRSDRTKPEFKFQVSDLIYHDGMGTKELLENITAVDREDGDVTDRIVIEKIVGSSQENSVIVFYAVSDKSGNVAKISRAFPAETTIPVTNMQEPGTAESDIPETDAPGVSENSSETGEDAAADDEMKDAETGDNAGENGNAEESVGDRENTADGQEAAAGGEEAQQAEDTQAPVEETLKEQTEEPVLDKGKKPVITLKTGEVTTTVGVAPAWVDVIGSLSDDKDSYETLFYNLSVSKYDMNKAGTYKVALTTKDSDGNKSDAVSLTITVK